MSSGVENVNDDLRCISGDMEVCRRRVFVPEQFEVVSDFDDIVIDPKVAARVANAVFERNNPGKRDNNVRMHSSETPFVIDARWEGYNAWPGDVTSTEEETKELVRESGYRVHIPYANADAGTDVTNRTFAWGLQRMLDAREKEDRMGQLGLTVMLSATTAMAAAPGGAILCAQELSGHDISLLTVLPTAVGIKMFGPAVWDTIKHMARNTIVKPDTIPNMLHLRNTIKHVGRLGLEPMLYEIDR